MTLHVPTTRLSKFDLISPARWTRDEPFEELGGSIRLRTLTDGEFARIEMEQQTKLIKTLLSNGVSLETLQDREAMMRALPAERLTEVLDVERASNLEIVRLALTTDDEEWTVAEVEQLRPVGIVDKIAERVQAISGKSLAAAEAMRSFRGNGSGAGDSDPVPDGVSPGILTS